MRSSFRRRRTSSLWAAAVWVLAAMAGAWPGSASSTDALERRLDASADRTWAAAVAALEPLGVTRRDTERGALATGWIETEPARSQGVVLRQGFRRRSRFRLTVEPAGAGSRVTIRGWSEERAPGGSRAFRWERAQPSADELDALADRVEARLAEPQPPAQAR